MTEGNRIVLYEGSPLERMASSTLVARNTELVKPSRFFLGSDVFTSQFGIKAFLLMDTKPEKRWLSYTDSRDVYVSIEGTPGNQEEYFGMHWEEGLERTVRTAHFLHTNEGFKMVRYFTLPAEVNELFQNQHILGEPMIRQLATTLPENFDETDTNFQYAFSFTDYRADGQHEEQAERDRASLVYLLTSLHPESATYDWYGKKVDFENWGKFGHRAFVSFHLWPLYEPVRQAGEASIVAALANFDRFLSGGAVKHTLARRDLPTDSATTYLAPSQQNH